MVSEERNKKIVDNIGLVHSIANRFRYKGAEYDDLFQAGCVGLIKAVDNFDETLGYQFSTYAVPMIMGEIKRSFRDGNAIKVSRSLKEKSMRVQYAREQFCKKHEREPTVTELSEITGIPSEEMSEIINISTPVLSLSLSYDDDEEQLDIPVDENDKIIDRLEVNHILSKLNHNERRLITYRFFMGKTQTETAKCLGISQVQVSRKEKALLKKIREQY